MTDSLTAEGLHLRQMEPADMPAVAERWNAGWHDGHDGLVPDALARQRTLASFRDRLGKRMPTTRLAVAGPTIRGFSMISASELHQFYVAAEARGTGTARLLMEDAETRIRAAGHAVAHLHCAIGNQRARRFYEKSGWHLARTEPVDLETAEGGFTLNTWRFEKPLR